MHHEAQWRIQVFGQFRLVDPKGVPFSSRSARTCALLAQLALKRDLAASRSSLETSLFEDDLGRSAPNLALLLTRLKASLSKHSDRSPVIVRSGKVAFDPAMVTSDLMLFESHLERARAEYDPLSRGSHLVEALRHVTGRPVNDIDHPILIEDRSRIERSVLTAMGELASGPLGPQNRELLLMLLSSFEEGSLYDPVQFESVLRIYGGLGLKENVVAAFTHYESVLYDEYGESPRNQLTTLLNEILAKLESGTTERVGQVPSRPRVTVGRDDEIALVLQHLAGHTHDLVAIVGQSGVGKSHLLKTLYWLSVGNRKCAFFDLETVLPEAVPELIKGTSVDILFLDHLQADFVDMVAGLRRTHPEILIVTAGHVTCQLPNEFILLLSTLETGTPQFPGPAAEFISTQIETVRGGSHRGSPEKIVELAELCNGLPLALEVAGRLAATIGVDGTLGAWKRDPLGVHGGTQSLDRHRTLDHAILSSFVHLSLGAKRVIHTLTMLEGECHIDLLMAALKIVPRDFEDAILSGMVVLNSERPTVSLMKLTESVIRSHEKELGLDPSNWVVFLRHAAEWILDRLNHANDAVSVSFCLPLAIRAFCHLCQVGERGLACRMFIKLKLWFGSCVVPVSEIDRCASWLETPEGEGIENWAQCRLTLGAGYFHRGAYEKLLSNAQSMIESNAFDHLSPGTRCHLQMQQALGWRCLGDTERAFAEYKVTRQLAIDLNEQNILVTVCFNLGSLAEIHTQFEEAYQYFEEAANNINEDTDPRLEGSIHLALGRVMLRLARDPKEAEMILDAALFHAKGRKDTKLVYELLSTLAVAYYLRGEFLFSCSATMCAALLRSRHEPEFETRRQGTSSMTLMTWDFLELGLDDLAVRARSLLDRFEVTDTAVLWVELRQKLEQRTYVTPASLKTRPLSLREYREFLEEAIERVFDEFGEDAKVSSFVGYVTADDSAWSRMMKSKPSWSWKTRRPSSVSSHSHSYT